MTLSEDLKYRGLINQTTYKDAGVLDNHKVKFYFGVDPSSNSMTIGNLASLMVIARFLKAGHRGYLLVGGATGLIGDPKDNKKRELIEKKIIEENIKGLKEQFQRILGSLNFKIINNIDWFKDIGYLEFLREIGTHVPLRTMLGRDFISKRIDDANIGLNYSEFSYSLIQAYDFYFLNNKYEVNLQLCGADQWGNSIAGVDLVRRIAKREVNILSVPLVINKLTGKKFGKSEGGAIWLDETKTSVLKFYQFFINLDDLNIEYYLKIFSYLDKEDITKIMNLHHKDLSKRFAQKELAYQITKIVHGENKAIDAKSLTSYLTGEKSINNISNQELATLNEELSIIRTNNFDPIALLIEGSLVKSKSEARKLVESGAIYLNNQAIKTKNLDQIDNGVYLLRRGKALKDSIVIIKN